MKIHHLNCGSLCPVGGRLVTGKSGPANLVCHCLLIETEAGLVLVDTGFGEADIAHANTRLARTFRWITRPTLDPSETAIAQVKSLGFSPQDVQHIVVTHLDLDHAGGLSDFPHAKVHLLADEFEAALNPLTYNERQRYMQTHWAHDPHWVTHSPTGESWMGFECVRDIAGLPSEILIVPLKGHTRGHSGIAVEVGQGESQWLVHAGDAYFHHGEMEERPHCPTGLRIFQGRIAVNDRMRKHNQKRLRELKSEKSAALSLFCAHDPHEFESHLR